MSTDGVSLLTVHRRVVGHALDVGAELIQQAYSLRAEGTFLVVVTEIDDFEVPTRIIESDIFCLSIEEIGQLEPSMVDEVAEGFRLADLTGEKAALFVIQDSQRSAVMVHSLSRKAVAA